MNDPHGGPALSTAPSSRRRTIKTAFMKPHLGRALRSPWVSKVKLTSRSSRYTLFCLNTMRLIIRMVSIAQLSGSIYYIHRVKSQHHTLNSLSLAPQRGHYVASLSLQDNVVGHPWLTKICCTLGGFSRFAWLHFGGPGWLGQGCGIKQYIKGRLRAEGWTPSSSSRLCAPQCQ